MRQLPLPIAVAHERTFDNFLTGDNALTVAHLQSVGAAAAPVYLWGLSGSGKTHLLQAMASQVQRRGGQVGWFDADTPLPWAFDERWALIVLDDCHRYDAEHQHAAFTLFVDATTHHVSIAAAGAVPPVDLALRDDLRTRLGWGHVMAVQPLTEAQTRAALRRDADRRGLLLSDDVLDFLMRRFERDLKHLTGLLDRLDQYALVNQRTLTVPLLRQMLSESTDDAH